MNLTRRDTGRLILASTSLLAIPGVAVAQNNEDLARQLQQEMNDHLLPGCGGQFRVTGFGAGRRSGRTVMAAIIRLDWPPGMRQRRFDAAGDNRPATYRNIVNQALFEFGKAWPGCVV